MNSLSTSIDSVLDDEQVNFVAGDEHIRIHSVDLSGSLHLIPGGIEIHENDLIYVNSSMIITMGPMRGSNSTKLFLADCTLQRFPVEGLYMIQEMRWNRLFRLEFHGPGLAVTNEFEELFNTYSQGFTIIKSRVRKEQISPKLSAAKSTENNSPTMKKRLADTFTTIRKRIRPVSEVFTNLKKRSNLKVAKSTESLVGGIMSPFSKKSTSSSANSHEKSINDFHDVDEIATEIDKVEKEDAALQKMQSVYLQNVHEVVPEEIIKQRAQYNSRLAKLRQKFNELNLLRESTSRATPEYNTIRSRSQGLPKPEFDRVRTPELSQSFSHHETSKVCAANPSSTLPRQERSTTIPRKPSRTRSARIVNKTNSMPSFTHDQSLKQLQSELLQVMNSFASSDEY